MARHNRSEDGRPLTGEKPIRETIVISMDVHGQKELLVYTAHKPCLVKVQATLPSTTGTWRDNFGGTPRYLRNKGDTLSLDFSRCFYVGKADVTLVIEYNTDVWIDAPEPEAPQVPPEPSAYGAIIEPVKMRIARRSPS